MSAKGHKRARGMFNPITLAAFRLITNSYFGRRLNRQFARLLWPRVTDWQIYGGGLTLLVPAVTRLAHNKVYPLRAFCYARDMTSSLQLRVHLRVWSCEKCRRA
jgi:hypothetical protein